MLIEDLNFPKPVFKEFIITLQSTQDLKEFRELIQYGYVGSNATLSNNQKLLIKMLNEAWV